MVELWLGWGFDNTPETYLKLTLNTPYTPLKITLNTHKTNVKHPHP